MRISPDPPQACGTSNRCSADDGASGNGSGLKDRAGCRYSHILNHVVLYKPVLRNGLTQGCTNPGCQFTWVTEFCTLAPNVCGLLSLELASCDPAGTQNFEFAPSHLANLCTRSLTQF